MYIDTNTFWVVIIALGAAGAWAYFSLKEKIEKKGETGVDIYFLVSLLFKMSEILFDGVDKETQERAEKLFADNEDVITTCMNNYTKEWEKRLDEEQQKAR